VVFNVLVDNGDSSDVRSSSTSQLSKEPSVVDDQLSRVFAALADPTRRDIVARLAAGDATVGELAAPYDVSVQAVSKHIRVLTDAGLVTQSRDAQRRPCHLEAEVFDLMTKWIERYRQQAQERYERLDAVLAEMQDGEGTNRPLPRRGAAS
jgi:DNA-binding transcriptional ArsR family regulator